MYRSTIVIAIAAVACLVAGCGSSDEGTAAGAEVTKAQFIKQAEAICNKGRDEAQKAATAWERDKGRKLNLNSALVEVLGPTLKQEAEELQSLAVPKKDEARITRMLGNLSKTATAFMEGPDSSTSSGSAARNAFAQEAKAYGLEACQI